MVLKFLRMGIVIFSIATLFMVPILIPINVIGQLKSEGLNLLTIGNVSDVPRTWAHVILAFFFTVGLIYYTFRETRAYLVLRREYLMSPEFAESVVARSLFVPSIPKDVHNIEDLARIFNRFPGGVRRIWINRDLKDLPDDVEDRDKKVHSLETAITKTILSTYKYNNKKGIQPENGSDTEVLIPQELRPTHRVSSLPIGLPFVGRKVDSIDYYHEEIQSLNKKILEKQHLATNYECLSSAFIEFNQQIAAHMAAQTLIHSKELQMAPRYIEIAPTDIIWENMNIQSFSRLLRRMFSLSFTTVIIIFWAIPVVFVQGISTLESLSKLLPFLEAVQDLGPTVVGIIQGILPAAALAILVALVPIIFSMLSKLEGIPRKSFVELSVLHKFFFFQFVDVVLVSTVAGGIFNVLPDLTKNPASIINLLAEKLPRASTFFITYVMLQATNSAAQNLLQLVPYILSFVMPIFNTTPRDIYHQKRQCPTVNLGTLIPTHSVIFVLGIEYSTIAPLILPFVLLFFCFHYFVLLYQFMHVYERPYETGGRGFPRAIRHVYIGMFTWQITMIGLFAVRGNKAIGQLVVMIILLVAGCFSLALYDKAFKPLFKFLPIQCMPSKDVQRIKENAVAAGDVHRLDTNDDDKRVLFQTTSNRSDTNSFGDGASVLSRDNLSIDAFRYRTTLHDELKKEAKISEEENDEEEVKVMTDTARRLYETESYLHPSVCRNQPTVWIPEDTMGIAKQELSQLKSLGIISSTHYANARPNDKGKPKVTIDEENVIMENKGIPGERPSAAQLSDVNDFVRVVIDNYNFIDALGTVA
ncbi:hypothetical protein J3Q64DRAFT_1811006 [Phycomyces blakesleeanus]|uniref:DUF221-domain-containing protein n=1 Tax=Phycomyces blakesleeanus TaxID=4837 RepID=A0ABR3API8_PHYBL